MRSVPILACALAMHGAAFAALDIAGWVRADSKSDPVPREACSIVRSNSAAPGKEQLLDCDQPLRACDRVRLKDRRSSLNIALANGDRGVRLNDANPAFSVPCSEGGLSEMAAAFLRALFTPLPAASANPVGMGTRGVELQVAGLGPYSAKLVAGERALYVAWRGGTPPFDVTLKRADGSKLVAEHRGVSAGSTRLPAAALSPGRHVLAVVGADGAGIEDPDLQVVPLDRLPPMPPALAAANLSEVERALLGAYYLENLADGGWTLEAVQRIAALPGDAPIVKQWLARLEGR